MDSNENFALILNQGEVVAKSFCLPPTVVNNEMFKGNVVNNRKYESETEGICEVS